MTQHYYTNNNNNIAVESRKSSKASKPESIASVNKNIIKILNSFIHKFRGNESPEQVGKYVDALIQRFNHYDMKYASGLYQIFADKFKRVIVNKRQVLGILIHAQQKQFTLNGRPESQQDYSKMHSLAEQVAKITATKGNAVYYYDEHHAKAELATPDRLNTLATGIIEGVKANAKIRQQIGKLRSKLITF